MAGHFRLTHILQGLHSRYYFNSAHLKVGNCYVINCQSIHCIKQSIILKDIMPNIDLPVEC